MNTPDPQIRQTPNGFSVQSHFLDHRTLEAISFETLNTLGFEDIGRVLLGLACDVNNSVLNTGYNQWERVLTCEFEDGPNYRAAIFRTMGDFGSKSGGTSYLHRFAKIVLFADSRDIRVRFLMTRSTIDDFKPPYLVGMVDKDYVAIGQLDARYKKFETPFDRSKTIAFDLCNHMLAGVTLFTDEEPNHPTEPPLMNGSRYQTFTSIIPAFRLMPD